MLELRDIDKRFGKTVAVEAVSCAVQPGTVHAFLGENGAGKTTLMRILAGATRPDTGVLLLEGESVRFNSVADGRRAGIGMVHQHFSLHSSLTVLENLAIADEYSGIIVDRDALIRQSEELASKIGARFEPDQLVADLPYAERQKLEVVRLLCWGARTLVLDEPTSVLSTEEAGYLLEHLRMLADQGHTVLLVTHKLHEALNYADRITVLRKGRVIGTIDSSEADESTLLRMMFDYVPVEARPEQRSASSPGVAVRVDRLAVRDGHGNLRLAEVSFEVRRGEIFGVAGIAGDGRELLIRVLAGLASPGSGSVEIATNRDHAAAVGPAYIPAERLGVGTVPSLSVLDNLALRRFQEEPFTRWGVLDATAIRSVAEEMIAGYGLSPSVLDRPLGELSGGNIQRVILARELWGGPSLIIAEEPTHGLDMTAVRTVHDALRSHARRGAAIVVASSDLDELHALCDRLLVLHGGRASLHSVQDAAGADARSAVMAIAGVWGGEDRASIEE